MKRIGVLFNPIAGRGRAAAAAKELIQPLKSAGCSPVLQPVVSVDKTGSNVNPGEVEAFISGLDCLVIAGGDGTVRYNIEAASTAGVPIWNLPAGNECLFARHFGMKAGAGPLLAALSQSRTEDHHFGRINGQPFFLMASAGLDAAVIHRLHRSRTGGVTWRNYVVPTLLEMFGYSSAEITVVCDGQPLIRNQRGFLIAANCKEYAWRIDPVAEADSTADLLHLRFFPQDGSLFYLQRLWAALFGREPAASGELRFCGRQIEISSIRRNVRVQADGEPAGELPVKLELAEKKLRVLLPAG